jgi:hypothetical protein
MILGSLNTQNSYKMMEILHPKSPEYPICESKLAGCVCPLLYAGDGEGHVHYGYVVR